MRSLIIIGMLVVVSAMGASAVMQCWGSAAKPCMAIGSQSVETKNCIKDTCSAGQKCTRATTDGNTVLLGCLPAPIVGCMKADTEAGKGVQCFCETNLCNGAESAWISRTAMALSFVACILALLR